ncbi:MAG TPA: HEAT repeat domain-containing protein [Pseudomonadota bacterium]|nr:HEAT repeat domain-containing protein [Pseudomonadota bacterium]
MFLGLLGCALLPTLGVVWRAVADSREPEQLAARGPSGDDSQAAARKKVLATLATDPTVLINVTEREMPASPDILNLGKRSTAALERCVADNAAADLRALCAELIGVLGDRRGLPTLYTALEDWEPEVRFSVIKSLAKMPDERSIEPLLRSYRRRDEDLANRKVILATLGQLSSRRAIKVLREELRRKPARPAKDGEEESAETGGLRPAAFAALWHARRLIPRSAIEADVAFALTSGDDTLIYPAVLAAAELGSPRLVRPLLPLLENGNPNTLNKAVYALGRIGDKSATRPLLGLLPGVRDARLLNNIAFALERLDRSAFFAEIGRLSEHKQAIIRLNAAFVIGDVRRPEGRELLAKSLADPSERVKLEAISAIAKLPSAGPRAAVDPLLAKALADPSDSIKLEAIAAIVAKNPDAIDRAQVDSLLGKLLADKEQSVQQAAIEALASHGTAAAIPALEGFIKSPSQKLREEAIYAIHALSGQKRGQLIYEQLLGSSVENTRRRAAIALGKVGDGRVRDYLLGCFEAKRCSADDVEAFLRADTDPGTPARVLLSWARDRTELAPVVAGLKPVGASQLVASSIDVALAQQRDGVAKDSIDLLGALGDARMRPRLQPLLRNSDAWLRVHSEVALARLGEPSADAALLGELDNLPSDWLPAVARFVARLSDAAVRTRLVAELARREAGTDFPVALAAAAIRLEWQPEQALPRLLTALASERVLESDLAERYLRRAENKTVTKLLDGALKSEKQEDTRVRLRKLIDSREKG